MATILFSLTHLLFSELGSRLSTLTTGEPEAQILQRPCLFVCLFAVGQRETRSQQPKFKACYLLLGEPDKSSALSLCLPICLMESVTAAFPSF